MDGAFFLWFTWMGVVITAFFHNHSQRRKPLIVLLLTAICLVNIQFNIMNYTVTALFLLVWGYGYRLLLGSIQVTLKYGVLVLITVTAAYTAIKLFSVYDPVFTYLYTKWTISAFLFAIVHITLSGTAERCSFLLIGIVHGESILTTLFEQMGINRIAGSPEALDIMAISIMGTIVWHYFVQLTLQLEKHVKEYQERRGYS
ncbi:hypothetical protein ABFG93_20405 [Pseudalkalibacillus hwajinpoensis]|uniref:YphA family membrane protein n=1 Tax=Guptibacillus hwajinpoensis TaxID=208199 RepID=UPI00325AD200